MSYEYTPVEWDRLRGIDARLVQLAELFWQARAITDELAAENLPGMSTSRLPTYVHWCSSAVHTLAEAR